MSDRVPAALLSNLGASVKGGDLLAIFRWLRANPILLGRLMEDIELAATTTVQRVPHGMKRAYRGAFVVCQGSPSAGIRVVRPSEASEPAKFLSLQLSSGTATTFSAWVF